MMWAVRDIMLDVSQVLDHLHAVAIEALVVDKYESPDLRESILSE